MAKKLRWHKIRQTVGDGTTAENDGNRYTNETGFDALIRQIHANASLFAFESEENMIAQLSTQRALAVVDDEDEFRIEIGVSGSATTGAAVDDLSAFEVDHWYFDRGQLVLETGETLASSMTKSSGGVAIVVWLVGYELDQ